MDRDLVTLAVTYRLDAYGEGGESAVQLKIERESAARILADYRHEIPPTGMCIESRMLRIIIRSLAVLQGWCDGDIVHIEEAD